MARKVSEILADLKANNEDDYNVLSSHITAVNRESADRKDALREQDALVKEIVSQLKVDDVKQIPTQIETQNKEFNALVGKMNEMQENLNTLQTNYDKSQKQLSFGTDVETLTNDFKAAGFDNPEYHAKQYAKDLVKGETGDMINGKFKADFIKDLGEKMPSFLTKSAPAKTETKTTETVGNMEAGKFDLSDSGLANMSDEFYEKNKDAIKQQALQEAAAKTETKE